MDVDCLDRTIREVFGTWDHLGTKSTPSGTKRWRVPTPSDGLGFLHQAFAPISEDNLLEATDHNPLFKKFSYLDLLTRMNGMNSFYRSFCLFGMHHQLASSLDMPFNLLNANMENWGGLSGPEQLVIGGGNLGWRSDTYVQRSDGSVFAAGRLLTDRSGIIFYEWDSLEVFVRAELSRLSTFFDHTGKVTCDLEPLNHTGGKAID